MAAHLLGARAKQTGVYLPLALFFCINALTEFGSLISVSMVTELYPYWPRLFVICSVPLHLMLAPLFWLYVRALTSEHRSLWRKNDLWHFALAFLTLCIPAIGLYLGEQGLIRVFDRPRLTTSDTQALLVLTIKTVEPLIILQVAFYITVIIRRLAQYQATLVQLFASTEHLELKWIRWLAVFLVLYIVISGFGTLSDNALLLEPWESLVDLALLWFLIIWSLRQKPGLASEVEATQKANLEGDAKYQRSALSNEQLDKIAAKVEASMQEHALYRDTNLSLRILSAHINELPNYVSQALNQKIGESFFDYVNRWRVAEAKQRLTESDLTVLAISEDVGFNSRSSFYKAFKNSTGHTPTAYKKAQTKA